MSGHYGFKKHQVLATKPKLDIGALESWHDIDGEIRSQAKGYLKNATNKTISKVYVQAATTKIVGQFKTKIIDNPNKTDAVHYATHMFLKKLPTQGLGKN